MTTVLIHELPEKTNLLRARLQHLLSLTPGTHAEKLLKRSQAEPTEQLRMVLTGQYSSGKSSLIKALTDGAVDPHIDADIATSEVEEYAWDGSVTLVDTPGVQTGLRVHDELAMEAIGTAEFILFTVTPTLFDDALRDHLRLLANDLGKFAQIIIVITKSSTSAAEDGVRARAVQEALGTVTYSLPIVEIDSVQYLRSLQGGPRADARRQQSRIDQLRAAINVVSEERGQLALLRRPLQLIRQLSDEAQELFVSDDRSRIALQLLAAQAKAISERRSALDRDFLHARTEFIRNCSTDVTKYVDAIFRQPPADGGSPEHLVTAEAQLIDDLERHATQLGESINRFTQEQRDTLSSQLLEIGDSNRMNALLRSTSDVTLRAPVRVASTTTQTSSAPTSSGVDWHKLGEHLKQGQGLWGAGSGLRDASGSLGHKLVKDIGHTFGHKFKPWQAIKIADKIGKAAKFGGAMIQVGAAGYEVLKNERDANTAQIAREEQYSALVTEIMGHADKIAAEARQQLSQIVDPELDAIVTQIRADQDNILNAEQATSSATAELCQIAAEADRLQAIGATNPDFRPSP